MNNTCYIGYSTDQRIRFEATSGGVGSAIIKYLLDNKIVEYALTFDYNNAIKKYYPKLISDFHDYVVTASIYHEMDMLSFYKEVFNDALCGKSIAVFALPCQTPFIRSLAKKKKIEVIIVGLTCSSQQTFDATRYLMDRINVNLDDVIDFRYRGNGWPSGIQIKLKNGKECFYSNNNSIWTSIFHSRLFIREKCFKCQDTLNRFSDIVLADPWLKEYFESEKIGQTLFMANTPKGLDIIRDIIKNNYVVANYISVNKLQQSQLVTIKRKEGYKRHPKTRAFLISLVKNKVYRRLILSCRPLYNLHMSIKERIEKKMK